MKQGFLLFSISLLLFFQAAAKKEINILFIGNSYTYRNHMPKIFEKLAKLNGKSLHVYTNTKGMTSFYRHSKRQNLYKAIAWKKWDYVILQGSSRDMIKDSVTFKTKTIPGLEKIIGAVKQNNKETKMLFFMTWAYQKGYGKRSYFEMTKNVKSGYEFLSDNYNIPVVPVGLAWREVRMTEKKSKLYHSDGAHPSLQGSYLVASCFYVSIYKERIKKHLNLFDKSIQRKIGKTSFATVKSYKYSPLNFDKQDFFVN
jgi:hypothetical protein